MQELANTLTSEFMDKEYAHAYVEDFSNLSIAAQIKVLREQRGWTQAKLAEASGMEQARISALEDVNYEGWTIKTLQKLARAFDLTAKMSFETFSSCIADINAISKETLEKASREEDLTAYSKKCAKSYEEKPFRAVTTLRVVTCRKDGKSATIPQLNDWSGLNAPAKPQAA